MRRILILLLLPLLGCQQKTQIPPWVPYDQSEELAQSAKHESKRMRFKLIQSKVLDKNDLWRVVEPQLRNFSEEDYVRLKPLIFEQDIPRLQEHVAKGELNYEKLTQWYLYRIVKYENDRNKYLNALIAINPKAVAEARERDRQRPANPHPLYGMPVLLKDNINTEGMPTTAGAHFLLENHTGDAFITKRIKEKGGIILGKTNLSEWANFLFIGGPNGFSAVGGQTLNPYGRRKFDTGGSSSGSGVAMAVNYAAAAVGTETSGSILSPSSQNSIVGLKPTVGLLSRGGIVPISATYDTPGPMTRSVIDNAILLSALLGKDPDDPGMASTPELSVSLDEIRAASLKGVRLGAFKNFLDQPQYQKALDALRSLGATIVEFEPISVDLNEFGQMLSADMKIDLPNYLSRYAAPRFKGISVADIVEYNKQDSTLRIPYGQARFAGMLKVDLAPEEVAKIKRDLHEKAVSYFETPMKKYNLDALLSINNRHARYSACASYPCLTVPMGYRENGYPIGLTFIARPWEEVKLLRYAYAFEQATRSRKPPELYQE